MTAAPYVRRPSTTPSSDPIPGIDIAGIDIVGIDMRCAAVSADTAPGTGRCQLLAGHDGPHAVMYADSVERRVLLWRADTHLVPADDDWVRLPWTRGFPTPAWFASGP